MGRQSRKMREIYIECFYDNALVSGPYCIISTKVPAAAQLCNLGQGYTGFIVKDRHRNAYVVENSTGIVLGTRLDEIINVLSLLPKSQLHSVFSSVKDSIKTLHCKCVSPDEFFIVAYKNIFGEKEQRKRST